MSYCRWSSDDYQCDVYVYQCCDGGYATHVAGLRYVFSEPLPPPIEFDEGNVLPWVERQQAVSAIVGRSSSSAIDLPEAGSNFFHETPGECADNLERLRALGYRVPQSAIDELREDQQDLNWEEAEQEQDEQSQ